MYAVPNATTSPRSPSPWITRLPLLLAALALTGSALLPWMHNLRFAELSCHNHRACATIVTVRDIAGKDLPYAPDLAALAAVLALHGAALAKRRGLAVELIKLAALGLALAWQLMVYRAIQRLGYGPLLSLAPDPAAPWGHILYLAGAALLGLALVLGVARLALTPRETDGAAARVAAPPARD
ncbi:MAG TPA: hypothetical protein VGE07_02425 [Herpetosiphonaceae bacterium]